MRWTTKPIVLALAAFLVGLPLGALVGERQAHAQTPSPQVAAALDHAADTTGLSRRFLYCVAKGESRFLPGAEGDHWTSHGLMQFKWGTWNANAGRYGFAGYTPYHAWAAAHVAAGMMRDGLRSHWSAARSCGSLWW
jgi:hypothetical protein